MGGLCCKEEKDRPIESRGPPPSRTGGGVPKTGSGQNYGGGVVGGSSTNLSARDAAAAAALKRQGASGQSETDAKKTEMRTKQELIGRINVYYGSMAKDPPIGLASSSVEQLQKHLEYVKGQTKG